MARILVVDDLADNRGLVVQLLELEGYELQEAEDGAQAIAAIEAWQPDLVLLDLMMPDIDGFAVLSYLREGHPGFLPVIAVSAASERDNRLRALKLGAHEFLAKPVDGEELRVRVGTLLELKAARDRADALAHELKAHAARVEEVVYRRTEELEAANSALREGDRYKDEFLSVISHELRTPLNFITGFASILEDELHGPLTEGQRVSVGRILAGSERMLGLVNDLLEYARLRSGKQPLELAPVDVGTVIEEVMGSLEPLAAQKQLDLELLRDLVGPFLLDGPRLTQIFTNLVSNAIKFTARGGHVLVKLWTQHGLLCCEVRDNGIGISPENLDRVFERFWQADMTNTREAGGTGLGLSITRALVEAHGGVLGARSEPGVGTTFWFQLPVFGGLTPMREGAATPKASA